MARFKLTQEVEQEVSGIGTAKYGDVVAVIETNIDDPGVLGRMISYGQVLVKRLADDETVECKAACGAEAESDPEASEPQPHAENDSPEGEPAESDEPITADAHPLDGLEDFGVDAATIEALKKAGVDDIATLVELVETGEKIKGVGELREKQLRDALPALKAAS